jgi:hypothetical protein
MHMQKSSFAKEVCMFLCACVSCSADAAYQALPHQRVELLAALLLLLLPQAVVLAQAFAQALVLALEHVLVQVLVLVLAPQRQELQHEPTTPDAAAGDAIHYACVMIWYAMRYALSLVYSSRLYSSQTRMHITA